MACIICGAAAHPPTAGWTVGELCPVHYAGVAARYNVITDANLLADVIKVHTLLHHNVPQCMVHLGALAAELASAAVAVTPGAPVTGDPRFAKAGVHANYVKLSLAMEYYEGYAWFPANRMLLGGLLSGPDFLKSVKMGHNKDPGAGKAHGEQSHRIQWHVLMREMTNSFTAVTAPGWTHSPLSLFFQLTQRYGSIWGKLLDAQANPGWANPDNVKADVLTSGHANIAGSISRRAVKMGGGTIALPHAGASPRDQQIQASYIALVGLGTIAHAGGLLEKITLQIYTWEKFKTAPPTAHNTPEKRAALAVYNHATAAAPLLFGLKGNYRKIGSNLLAKRGAPDVGVKINPARVALSMGGFNVGQYSYNAVNGAYPSQPGRF